MNYRLGVNQAIAIVDSEIGFKTKGLNLTDVRLNLPKSAANLAIDKVNSEHSPQARF
jgi:hypothetical protein